MKKPNPFEGALALIMIRKKPGVYETRVAKNETTLRGNIGDHVVWLREPTTFERESAQQCITLRLGSELEATIKEKV